MGLVWAGLVAGPARVWARVWAQVGGQAAASAVGAKRPMTFADLMAMKRVSDPQISPSGKWVMFSVTEVSLAKNTKVNHLWVVPLAGTGGPEKRIPFGDDKQKGDDKPKSPAERQVTFGPGEANGRFSPDGKWVSWTADWPQNGSAAAPQIWLAGWDEATGRVSGARALTQVSTGADGAIWSPDSQRLMFVSSVYPKCSDKAGWIEEEGCDRAKDEAAAKDPVKAQVWEGLLYRHWDHYVGEKRSHVLVVSARDGAAVRDLTPRSAVGDAETPTFSLGGPLGYAWAPDSKEIAYVANLDAVPAASTNNDVFTLRLDEVGAKAVKVSTSPGSDDGPAYSPDGKWLAFRSQARAGYESDRFRLMVVQRVSESAGQRVSYSAPRELMPKFANWVDEFVWAADSNSLLFASGEAGAEQIFQYSMADKTLSMRTDGVRGDESADADLARDLDHSQGAEYGSLVISLDGHWIVSTMMSVRAPTEVVALHVEDREEYDDTETHLVRKPFDGPLSMHHVIFHEQRLTHSNDHLLTQLEIPRMEDFWFAGADNTKVQGFVIRPPGFDVAKKYPVKFLIHGGPQGAWGDGWSYRWNAELMAASGYVVVMVNPRGSVGYGQKFVEGVSGDWGGKAYVDLMRGLDAAEARFPFIDKTRECALGASYGGYMADWILTHTNRFKCIVTHDGMVDAVAAYGSTEEMWFNEWEFRRAEDFPKGWDGGGAKTNAKANTEILTKGQNDGRGGGDEGRGGEGHPAEPWRYAALPAEQDPFRKWSPIRFIQNAKTPTLVIHSQKDYRLDVSQGFELFTALQRLGVPSKFLYFPDEGHWVLKPKDSELWYRTVGDWCDRWTKGAGASD
jgi:dipeptidyl aminopeptidase/acylaminoacyl peptidase